MKRYVKIRTERCEISEKGTVSIYVRDRIYKVPSRYISQGDRVGLKDAAKAGRYKSPVERGELFLEWGRHITVSLSWRTLLDLPSKEVSF